MSEHLQEWVDLIWGFKQSGEAAVSALNTYPEWMYPSQTPAEAGAEEFKKVYDGGQMPEQLFRKPHPKRVLRALIKKPLSRPYKDTVYPVVARECLPSEVVRIFATPKSLVLLCHDGFYTQCGIETSTKTGPSIAVKLDKAITQAQQQQQSPSHIELPTAGCGVRLASTVAYCPEANALVSGGVWDGTLRVRSPKANGVRKACAADGAVTCLAYDKGFLVAGTDGAAVAVYDLRGCSGGSGSNTLLKPHSSAQDPLGLPRHFLGGHMSSLSAVAVSEDLDLVVSASCGEEPVCLIHTLREGALLREIQTPEQVDMVMISRGSSNGNGGGVILLYSAGSGTLQALSVNCAQLATATLPPAANNAAVTKEGTPLPMAVSIDGRLLAVAPGVPAADRDAGPVLEVLTPHDLCSVKTVALSGPVEALEFTADSNFVVVSYADGPVVAVYVGHLTP